MDLALSPEQEQLVDGFRGLYTKHSSPERVREAEPAGFDADLWTLVSDLGIVSMAVPEHAGGWGASLLDLALLAELQGRFVSPIPAIEAQVAARLLARLETGAGALADVLSGQSLITFAPRSGSGALAELVPAGLVADYAVLLHDDRLLLVELDGYRTSVENLGCMPLADIAVGGPVTVLADGLEAKEFHSVAVDEWMALTAAALVGIGARALEIGVDYVTERHAFGVAIGSFQAIAHPLADSAAAVDGARLLAYEAAWAASEVPTRGGELAAMAFAFAYESARDVTYRSLHFHGGYGFMMEYDIQLYYRRARGWANVFAGPEQVYRDVTKSPRRNDQTPLAVAYLRRSRSRRHDVQLKAGTKIKSAVCDVEAIVIRAPGGDLDLGCGGSPMVEPDFESAAELDPELAGGSLIGKRYVDEDRGVEILCTRSGAGTLTIDGVAIPFKGANPLPSSD